MVFRHPPGFGKEHKDHSSNEQRRSRKGADDVGQLKGLCVNCANREVCRHPKPEGGVWHCEEFVEER